MSELEALRKRLEEYRKNLPAHTVRVHQLQRIEELEERIETLARQYEQGGRGPGSEDDPGSETVADD